MGFWSTLGGIVGTAAGFIPGVGPIASMAIKAATGVGGMIGDAVTGGGPGGSESGSGGGLSVDASKNSGGVQNPAVQQGLDTLQGPKNYLNGAIGGSQETMEGLLGPDVSTILSQYDNAAKTAAELGPRGGGRTAILAEAPFKKAGEYGRQLAGAKQTALSELPKIGESEAQIGNQATQLSNSFKLGQANVNAEQNRNILTGNAEKNKSFNDIGSGIGGILTRIIAGKKSGSPSSTDANLSVNDQYKLGF